MLVLLSPAKSLDYDSSLPTKKHTKPRLLDDSEELVEQLRKRSVSQLGSLMSISEKLSELNMLIVTSNGSGILVMRIADRLYLHS